MFIAPMPRGPEIALDELQKAIAVYLEKGTYAAAAEAIGRDLSVVRRALLRAQMSEKVSLHARAVETGLRNGRKALTKTTKLLSKKATGAAKTSELVGIAKGLSLTLARLTDLAELELKRRDAKLRGKKMLAEIEALQKGTALTAEQVLAYLASLPREEIVRILGMLRREPQLPTSTGA